MPNERGNNQKIEKYFSNVGLLRIRLNYSIIWANQSKGLSTSGPNSRTQMNPNEDMDTEEDSSRAETMGFDFTRTYDNGRMFTEETTTIEVSLYDLNDLLDQALRGTLEGVDEETIRTELEARSIE